jgi:monoamine oxidase
VAAYELKKAGIPFRIFEASSRVGGRVYTLDNFNSEGQTAELGAEYFEEDHRLIFDLCQELNLPIDEVKWDKSLEKQISWSRGKILTVKETLPRLQKLSAQLIRLKIELVGDRNEMITPFNFHEYPAAERYDQMPIAEILKKMENHVDSETLRLFETTCLAQFGRSLEQVSSLHLINTIDLEASSQRNLYKVRYGNQRLLRTLYDRVSSVLPDFFVRLDSALVEISEKGGYFQCYFKTPQGSKHYQARHIIMALPINQYKNIEGFGNLKLSSQKKESMQKVELAAHTKVVMGYKQRFWLKKQESIPASRGCFIKDSVPQITWDGSATFDPVTTGLVVPNGSNDSGAPNAAKGIFSVLVGGEVAETAGSNYSEQVIKDLQVFSKSFKTEYDGNNHVMNWKHRTNCQGSFVMYRPGQFLNYHGVWSESDYEGRLAYAGEHCHLTRYGTLVGALESGRKAALDIIGIFQKDKKT